MSYAEEYLERLINRSLDGALSAEEQLELDREILRNPQARLLMDQCREVDELAGRVLEDVVAGGGAVQVVPGMVPTAGVAKVRRRSFNRGWLLVPGAIAAAILAVVIPRPTFTDREGAITDASNGQPPIVQGVVPAGRAGPLDIMQPVSSAPTIRRNTGRDLIGVIGDDGNLYWIEVERTRTVRLPRGRPISSQGLNEL